MGTENRLSDDEIAFFYNKSIEYRQSGIGVSAFCENNNLSNSRFTNFLAILNFRRKNMDEFEKQYNPAVQYYKENNISISRVAAKFGLNLSLFIRYLNNLRYIEVINNYIKSENKEQNKMQFINVSSKLNKIEPMQSQIEQQEPEILEKKNDIELIISKGVRVIVSPEIATDKLVRIIDLLKDL